jgi:putative oxidoreductase
MNPKSSVVVIARLLLALMFVLAGISKFADLGSTAGYIGSKGLPLPLLLAIATAALELLGGLAIIVGFRARAAAIALALFTLLATLLFHNFWAAAADQQYVQQLMFMKNLSVAGGLLLLFSFGAGGGSVDARRSAVA